MERRKTLIAFIIFVCFFLWILPLGAFIDVSKEGKVCGGMRAFCLCSSQFAHPAKTASSKSIMTVSSGVEKEGGLFGSASRDFVSVQVNVKPPSESRRYFELPVFSYSSLVLRSIEHVPKA